MERMNYAISEKEINYLRELAKKQLEYANKPIMKEREGLWYQHNDIKGVRPMIFMEDDTFWSNICPNLKCENPFAREIEENLLKNIVPEDLIEDDRVVPDFYKLELNLEYTKFGVEQDRQYASDGLGYHISPVLEDLEEDLDKLSPSEFACDFEGLQEKADRINEIIGDILPVKMVNAENRWQISVPQNVIELMGMEDMFVSMISTPDEFHQLMNFITEDRICMLRWQEEHGYIWLNNGNDYTGSGNITFSHDLPGADFDGKVKSIHTWGHINSQETVGVSPEMFKEFILPYMKRTAAEFGMIYYGCCEPVSDFWENGIEEIPNIRKISISPWCDEAYMAEKLAKSSIVYSRKPSPNFIGVQKDFDEDAFRQYIRTTVELTKNCETEFIFRDIYNLHGNVEKLKKAVQIVREETLR